MRADQMKHLAHAGRWWEVAAAASNARIDDPELLLPAAEAWARLGIPALATETLDRLCQAFPAATQHPGVAACRGLINGVVGTAVEAETLHERIAAVVSALGERAIDLSAEAERWRRDNLRTTVYIAQDGNAVRRRENGSIELIGNHKGASNTLIKQHGTALSGSAAPITIEGIDPPWLALDMVSATATEGYAPGIRIVQADAAELLDGLSLAGPEAVRDLIAQDRVQWFVGPSAAADLARAIEGEPGVSHNGPVVPLATLRTRVGPALAAAMQSASRRHDAEHVACLKTICERDRSRSIDTRVRAVAGDQPRVALIAGRFTTVLRPMIEDLAREFEARGASTRIITEPNDHRRLTPLGYSRVFAEFDPDLIVCANHTRDDADALLGERVMPRNVPWVTWVQDAMPHLLRSKAGCSIGPADLAIGHITPTMRADLGYEASRSISVPMVASEAKFSTARVDPTLAGDLECEIAAFTNHSETPEAMRARLIDEVSSSPAAAAIVERISDAALALAEEPIERVRGWRRCEAMVNESASSTDAETRENLFQNVAFRVYDRACRHRALGWARDVAERNSWRLAIYGKGWDAHAIFAQHARGTLEHGTPICTAYASARVTLDATVLTSLHQRVAECVLAGGLPSVLATGSSIEHARWAIKQQVLSSSTDLGTPTPGLPGQIAIPLYRVDGGERFTKLGSLLNGRSYPYVFADPAESASLLPPGVINADEAVGLLELGVWDAPSLERVVRCAADPAWRDAQRERVLRFVRENCTHSVLARRIIDHYASIDAAGTVAA
ncbi:MAG: hypothetical protein AAFR76_01640 [Planctomycetota bacterium]